MKTINRPMMDAIVKMLDEFNSTYCSDGFFFCWERASREEKESWIKDYVKEAEKRGK